jgi:hypothetical protein
LVTVNGTTYDVGDYEICRECMEYYYGFNHIRNWTVFNYDLDKDEVIQKDYTLAIPKVEGTSGGGTTTLAVNGLSCIDCYAYLAPEIQITLVWNEFYVTDFSAALRGSSVVNVGVGIMDPAFLEIGKRASPRERSELPSDRRQRAGPTNWNQHPRRLLRNLQRDQLHGQGELRPVHDGQQEAHDVRGGRLWARRGRRAHHGARRGQRRDL